MSIVQQLPELEEWLEVHTSSWHGLSDDEFKQLVVEWSRVFRSPIERRKQHVSGERALESFALKLPADVFLFSGVKVPEVANMGGRGAAGYRADRLDELDVPMACALELIVVEADLWWCLLLSHESGSWVSEEFWERRTS